MKKFSIYKPQLFYPSRTLVLYSIIFVLFIIAYGVQLINGHENEVFQLIIYLISGTFFLGCILRFSGLGKVKPIYGTLEGEIIFYTDTIHVGDKLIAIEDVVKIEFIGVDWVGDSQRQGWSFENSESNGTNNWVKIYLKGSILKVRFQKWEACELYEIKDVLYHYYQKNKISYDQIVDNLCLSPEEKQDLIKLPREN